MIQTGRIENPRELSSHLKGILAAMGIFSTPWLVDAATWLMHLDLDYWTKIGCQTVGIALGVAGYIHKRTQTKLLLKNDTTAQSNGRSDNAEK